MEGVIRFGPDLELRLENGFAYRAPFIVHPTLLIGTTTVSISQPPQLFTCELLVCRLSDLTSLQLKTQ